MGLRCGLIRMGRKVAVPHDPNGEWARVAEFVDGKTIGIGRGRAAQINLLDPGARDTALSDEDWRDDVLQFRRGTLKAVILQDHLRDGDERLSSGLPRL